jgi:L-ascorbate metabolism protein UlaG (beta-lactamase superfamily)
VSRRRTEPAIGVAELPELDAVVLSHLHGDHFDRIATAALTYLDRGDTFTFPTASGRK